MSRSLAALAVALASSVAAAQPMMGQGGEMPDPRMMSGQPRPQEGDPPGRLTVRAVQGKLTVDDLGNRVSSWPKDGVVHLLAYDARGGVDLVTKPLDGEGRAIFEGLPTDGSLAYRAVAIFERPGAEPGTVIEDRLVSQGIAMPPMVGIRLMLAGEAQDGKAAAVDDQTRGDEFGTGVAPPPGQVVVRLRGQTTGAATVELLRAGGPSVGKADAILQSMVRDAKVSAAAATIDPALRDGLVQVRLTRKNNPKDPGHDHGAPHATVELRAAGGEAGPPLRSATTGGDGVASFEGLPRGKSYVVRAIVQGATVDAAVTIPTKGGTVLPVEASWIEDQSLEARFTDVPAGADRVYYAKVTTGGRSYLSAPLQLTRAAGASTGILVYPDVVVSFRGEAELDDQRLFFRVSWSLINPTNSPRDVGGQGLTIPLPAGFRAAQVEETMAARVKVVPEGFLWRGPVPPGQKDFSTGFALDVADGKVSIALPLPNGAWESQLVFEDLPGMQLVVPAKANQRKVKAPDGKSYVLLRGINISPGQTMAMDVTGLPQPSAWQAFARVGVGLGVLGLLGWAVFGIFAGRRGDDRVDLRERLFGELVALEAMGGKASEKDQARRRALVDQLAALNAAEDRAADAPRAGDP